ncbi:hypothetical protein BDR05DRAFT_989973 [Suillus weaverae]|nr:hypothetical protein BDR05DRAFT_989973 [Suillus weaverae]
MDYSKYTISNIDMDLQIAIDEERQVRPISLTRILCFEQNLRDLLPWMKGMGVRPHRPKLPLFPQHSRSFSTDSYRMVRLVMSHPRFYFTAPSRPVAWMASLSDLNSSAEIIFKCIPTAYPQAFSCLLIVGRYSDLARSISTFRSLCDVPELSVEIRVSYELGRMLGSGVVIGKLETSWDELLDHGDEPFELSFPSVCDNHPSLTLKAAVLHPCDDHEGTLFNSLIDCKIARAADGGQARCVEYMTSKTVSYLNDAVDHFQSVLDQCPVDHPDRAAALANLAWARLIGYNQKDLQDIDSPISLFREALALPLGARYLKEDTTVDGYEAVQLHRTLLPPCPEGTCLRSLAAIGNGVHNVIDDNIQLQRMVLELYSPGHTGRPRAVEKLSLDLRTHFTQCGSIDDLDESIRLHSEVVSQCHEGHPARGTSLNNLASSLLPRFRHQGKSDDLNEAISLFEEALSLHPVGHEYRYVSLDNLVISLYRAISLHREALTLCAPEHPHRDTTLNNLAVALTTRYNYSHVREDLNEAINLYRESLRLKCFSHEFLKEAYLCRYRIQHNLIDLSLAVENFKLASRHATQGLPYRINVSYSWAVAAEQHDHGSALEAYSTFFELLDAHLATRSSITSRREAAAAFRYAISLPVDAASCAIRRGNLRYAVELLEQGRGQQTPLDDLESTNPKLARTFSEVSKHLAEAQGATVNTDRAAAEQAETQYRKHMEEWKAAVAEIRKVDDLQAAARHGPVIILIASKYSCGAIIVPKSGEPHHVYFPRITLTDLKKLKDDFAKAIKQASRMRPQEPRRDLRELLRVVWNEIMLPIVNVLEGDLKLRHRSRIWLCPTADFTSIPLHASNISRMNADCSGPEPCLEDLYICSYTPTLSALIRARQALKKQAMKKHVPPSFVAIGQSKPSAVQGKELVAVDSELELVHATRVGALEALQQNTWVHLACHGKQDHEQPYNSYFAMRDTPLTLLDIMDQNIPHAEFAFLSACHTAVGDEKTPDEVIHLAAGLQFSGFKSVIGTLWVVDDAVAKHVVKAFYEKMFEDLEDGGVMDCRKAARALNHATHTVKNQESPYNFIHSWNTAGGNIPLPGRGSTENSSFYLKVLRLGAPSEN